MRVNIVAQVGATALSSNLMELEACGSRLSRHRGLGVCVTVSGRSREPPMDKLEPCVSTALSLLLRPENNSRLCSVSCHNKRWGVETLVSFTLGKPELSMPGG